MPGDYVGEMALDGKPRSASVVTLEPTTWSPSEARMMLALAAGMAEHLGTVLQRARPQRP